MIAKKEEVLKTTYIEPNGKPVLEIVIKKYRRDFKGKYINYIIVYNAFGALAKRFKDKLEPGTIVKLDYRIESNEYNSNYYTKLILEKINIVEEKQINLFSTATDNGLSPSEEAVKDFLGEDDIF